ncbi:hypothetical protein KOM00_20345 [Geomonas sp. Red69]|uniref:hypothetical protein n=1 Tax=Geomonas diazotrophica TaxID=2843197 RepID=UPI001C0FC282|nr:hypothetical protein [Geomonas diazotrophica]MBU5639076.1 hypothetical protein [Geomonas diazotrophica]
MTKKEIRSMNRSHELGPYRKKTLADYPVLHAFLANVLAEAQNQLLQRISVKLTLGEAWLLNPPGTYQQTDSDFWLERVGAYRIDACDASLQCVTLIVSLPQKRDVFYPDEFVILTSQSTLQIYVCGKGKLASIDLVWSTKSPRFVRDLARDFSLGGRCARRKLRDSIRFIGEEPDATFLAPITFGRAATIHVE